MGCGPVTCLTFCHGAEGERVHSSIVRAERGMICKRGEYLAYQTYAALLTADFPPGAACANIVITRRAVC